MNMRRLGFAFALACAAALSPRPAGAFCGFYVGSAGARMYNHATQVVLMRDGLRTVLSMQNNYQGPPEHFALVVPVPIVLQKENVKTLSKELFNRIDELDAPRLVEYWEQDPCMPPGPYGYEFSDDPLASGGFGPNDATIRVGGSAPPPVQVLNRFSAGEYQIVILGARDSLGLETWLRENGYRIPAGAEAVLRPYVQSGMKFFVAKVDPAKVRFERGMATLSPLRFHYDAETFSLPIRLGLLSSPGVQDLIVHVLARRHRYQAANYENAAIPTNLEVNSTAQAQLGAFYAALFDRTLEGRPRTVITEYAWGAGTCDPCPAPPLDPGDMDAFGAEVLPEPASPEQGGFVLTRLHARYDKGSLGEDLVLRAALPITGGHEVRGADGALNHGATPSVENSFQARYVIRHPWASVMVCAEPRRGIWVGAPSGGRPSAQPAQDLAFAPRGGADLASFLGEALPELAELAPLPRGEPPVDSTPPSPRHGGCAGCRVGSEGRDEMGGNAGESRALVLASLLAGVWLRRRQKAFSSERSLV